MPPPRRSALDVRHAVAIAAGGLAAMARQAMSHSFWLAQHSMAHAAACSLGPRREHGRRRAESKGEAHAVGALAAAPHRRCALHGGRRVARGSAPDSDASQAGTDGGRQNGAFEDLNMVGIFSYAYKGRNAPQSG